MKKITVLIIMIMTMVLISCSGGSGGDSNGVDSAISGTVSDEVKDDVSGDVNNDVEDEAVTLSSDTSLYTAIGTIDGLQIKDIPFGTELESFRDGITVSEKASFEIYESDGVTAAQDLKSSYRVVVEAEDESRETYILSVKQDPRILATWEGFDPESDEYEIVGAEITDGLDDSSNALSFNGSVDDISYLLIPYSEDYNLREGGTLEITVKANSIRPYAGLISKSQASDFSDEAYGVQLYRHDGSHARLLFFIYGDDGQWIGIHGTFDIEVDTWYHIVATWDSDNMYLYVDGVLDGTRENTTGGVRATDAGITIGGQLTDKYNNTCTAPQKL